MPKNPLAVAAFVLSLLALVWNAAEQWGRVIQRIEHLEGAQRYLHGEIQVPGERK